MEQNKVILIGNAAVGTAVSCVAFVEKFFQDRGFGTEWINPETAEKKKLNEEYLNQAKLLVTFDLAGFERSTQSGSFLYNILSCKSIHFIQKETKQLREMLDNRKMSIALFFVGMGMTDEACKKLLEEMPLMPWLRSCPLEQERIEGLLQEISEELFLDV